MRVLIYSGLEFLGDGVMKLPFVRAVRAAWPEAQITWLAGKGKTAYAHDLAPLMTGLVDEIIEDAGIGVRWRELLYRPLQGRSFDVILDTQRRVKTTLILRRIRHKKFVSSCAGWRLSDGRPANTKSKPPHLVAQLMQLVEAARGRPAGQNLPFLALPRELRAAAALVLPDGPRYAGLVPGAGGQHKCWPLERYADLAKTLAVRGFRPVFLLGPAEANWKTKLKEAVPEALFPLKPGVSPLFTMAVGQRLEFGVANDCGGGHLLAAVDCPLVSLFGPTDPAKFAPATPLLEIVRAQDFGGSDMERIPVEAVLAAVERLDNSAA